MSIAYHLTQLGRLPSALTAWDDWLFTPSNLKLPAINDPSFAKYRDNGAGSTGVYGYFFAKGNVGMFPGSQLRHAYKIGTDAQPHVHFWFSSAPVAGETIEWTAEIGIVAIGATMGNTIICSGTYVIPAGVAQYDHVVCPLTPNISNTILGISACGSATLTRVNGGTYAPTVVFLGFDLHHQVDGFGSETPTTKS